MSNRKMKNICQRQTSCFTILVIKLILVGTNLIIEFSICRILFESRGSKKGAYKLEYVMGFV